VTVRVRLSGQPDEIAAIIDALAARFEIAGGERAYPNRGAVGVRVYLETRPHSDTATDTGTGSDSDAGRTGPAGPVVSPGPLPPVFGCGGAG